jgi:hypothetical protein
MRIFDLIAANDQSSTSRTGDEVLNAHPTLSCVCDDAGTPPRANRSSSAPGAPHRNALFFRQFMIEARVNRRGETRTAVTRLARSASTTVLMPYIRTSVGRVDRRAQVGV